MPEIIEKTLSYAECVNAALARALDEREETLLFGEDVAIPGGVFGVTKGLRKRFGERVFDTPISEAAILGSAVGSGDVRSPSHRRDHVGRFCTGGVRPDREPGRERPIYFTRGA